MTRQEIRLKYKHDTGVLPDGSMISLNGNPLRCNFDTELSAYITWLEDKVMEKQKDDLHSRIMKARAEIKTKQK